MYGINLSSDGRLFRAAKEKWNREFSNGDRPFYIAHSNSKGYKAVTELKDAEEALNILVNYNNKSARIVKKVLDSAIANAVNNHELDETKLYV